jgi:NADP-dependent 3-hydroxy acid dehydrogenase YdfG
MNKTIVISGGSKGLGKAIAQRFAAAQFNIAICARTLTDLEQLKKEFTALYPNSEIFMQVVDVKNKSEINDFAKNIIDKFDKIDVLVNNAGTYIGGEIHKEEEGVLEHLIETNLYSAYHLSRALLPAMLAVKEGHIFNICSIASLIAYPNGGSYSISKFAMYGFSKCLREELKDKGIKVTSILPGATWSDSWAGVNLPEDRIMPSSDIGEAVFGAYHLSKVAVVEDLVIRPQLGDL